MTLGVMTKRELPINTCKIKSDFDLSPGSVTTVSQFLFFGSKGTPLFRIQPLVAISVEIVGFVIDNSSSVFTFYDYNNNLKKTFQLYH